MRCVNVSQIHDWSNSIISEVQVEINLPGHAKQYHYAFTIRSSSCCFRLVMPWSAACSMEFSLSKVLLIWLLVLENGVHGLTDLIANGPVCKKAIKEIVCKAQEAIHIHLHIGRDLDVCQLGFEPSELALEVRD